MSRHRFHPAWASQANPAAPIISLSPILFCRRNTAIVVSSGVDTWPDASNNSHPLVQTTDTNRPTLNADGTVSWDGVDNYMAAAFTQAGPVTMFARIKVDTWASNKFIWDGGTGLSTSRIGLIMHTGTPKVAQVGQSAIGADDSDLTVGSWLSIAAVYNGASSLIQVGVGGTQISAGAIGNTNPNGILVGAAYDATGFAKFTLAEIAMVPVAATTAQIDAALTYLNTVI